MREPTSTSCSTLKKPTSKDKLNRLIRESSKRDFTLLIWE